LGLLNKRNKILHFNKHAVQPTLIISEGTMEEEEEEEEEEGGG
jgi:hypothetical protein